MTRPVPSLAKKYRAPGPALSVLLAAAPEMERQCGGRYALAEGGRLQKIVRIEGGPQTVQDIRGHGSGRRDPNAFRLGVVVLMGYVVATENSRFDFIESPGK